MQKESIYQVLRDKLAPVYQARVELVEKTDSQFFASATGQAELLNMALISQYMKKLSSDRELKRIHDEYFSTMFFHENQESLLAPLRTAGWNIDFNQQNFRRLVHHFAEDVGLDEFYNAMEEIPAEKAPINRLGEIKNWAEMKHSQVLSAPIKAYYFNGEDYGMQHISQSLIDSYCDEHLPAKTAENHLNFAFALQRQKSY